MQGRQYTVSWDAATSIAATTPLDIFEIVPADDKPTFVEELTMQNTSDFGDAQDEEVTIQIIRGFTTSGSGGATPTTGKWDPGGTAYAGTLECRNTTVATTGTTDILHQDGWNVRAPYIWTPPSDDWRPFVTQAQTSLVIRLLVGFADALTMNASIKIREMG